MTATEPEFVGAGRRAVVDGLLRTYDLVRDTGWPQWVVLEAPSGWGKTRIAREFYARLAAERQADPAYWPPGILESLTEGADTLSARRKRVFPHVTHNPGSLPDFMWWGIACATRDGLPTVALAEDLDQLRAHADYLEDAWRRNAPRAPRIAQSLTSFGAVAADEIVMEGVGTAAEALLGAAVPGLGLVRWLGERTVTALRDAGARRERLRGSESITAKADLADDTVAMVSRLALPDLPLVVFVEDLHDADASLSDLLAQLASRPGAVLIVTTSWPGSTAANPHVAEAMRAASDRVLVLDHRGGRPPAPFPAEASLAPLAEDALAAIVRFRFPAVDAGTLERIVTRYTNPLALELFCELPRVRRRVRDGVLTLSAETISESPAEIRGLYRELWNELPEPLREALSLAALGAPSTIGASGASAQWNAPLLLRALESLDWPTLPEVAAALGSDADAYSWVREVSSMLRAFHEPDQLAVAADDDTFLVAEDRAEVRTALAAALVDLAGADALPADDAVHLAEVATVLAAEGFLTDGEALARAALPAIDILAGQPREAHRAIALADGVLRIEAAPSSARLSVLELRAIAKRERGDSAGAVDDAQLLLDTLEQHGPADAVSLTRARRILAASLTDAGQTRRAIELLEDVVAEHAVHAASGAPEEAFLIGPRQELGRAYANAGRTADALAVFRALLESFDSSELTSLPALTIRNDIARTLTEGGRHQEAAVELSLMLDVMMVEPGPDDPNTLSVRTTYAIAVSDGGDPAGALRMFSDIVERGTIERGPDHPATLEARGSLVVLWVLTGRPDTALPLAESLLADAERALGPVHPVTVSARGRLAQVLAAVGRPAEGQVLAERIATDTAATYGPQHPSTLEARNNAILSRHHLGDVLGSLALLDELAEDAVEMLGPLHPLTLTVRHNRAGALREAGRAADAIDDSAALIAEMAEEFGPAHPAVLRSRGELGLAQRDDGRYEDALATHRSLLVDRRRMLGDEHPDTLATWSNATLALDDAGMPAEAVAEWKPLIAAMIRVHGADHPDTFNARSNLAYALSSAGAHDEAVELDRAVLADRVRVLGSRHPDAILSRNHVAVRLTDAGEPQQAVDLLSSVLDDLAAVLGGDHPAHLRVRGNLERALRAAGRYEDANAELVTVIEESDRILGETHEYSLSALRALGDAMRAADDPVQAAQLYEELVRRYVERDGEQAQRTAEAMVPLVIALRDAGDPTAAIGPACSVVAFLTQDRGPRARATLSARDVVAASLLEAGNASDAAEEYAAVLAETVEEYGEDDADIPTCESNLAAALAAAGRPLEVVEIRRRQVDRLLATDGAGAELDDARSVLAGALRDANLPEQAASEDELVLASRRASLGGEHPLTLTSQNNLAVSLSSSSRHEEAITLHREVFVIRERLFGQDAEETRLTRGNLAFALAQAGRDDEAIAAWQDQVSSVSRAYGERSLETFLARDDLANALLAAGRPNEAAEEFRVVLDQTVAELGADHPDAAMSVVHVARAVEATGDAVTALELFTQAEGDCARLLGPEHRYTLECSEALDRLAPA